MKMPAFTTNHGFSKPYESENYDINVQNNNWDKLDKIPYIVESGTTTAYRSNPNATTAQYKKVTWYYKKYSDGTLEAYATDLVTGLKCDDSQKQDGTWRSKFIRFYYPDLGQKVVFNRGCWISQADDKGSTVWVADVSSPGDGSENASYQSVRCVSTKGETESKDKNFYLSFRATY